MLEQSRDVDTVNVDVRRQPAAAAYTSSSQRHRRRTSDVRLGAVFTAMTVMRTLTEG